MIKFLTSLSVLLLLAGCVNSSFTPTISANLSLYNRGGSVEADTIGKGADGAEYETIATEGGGALDATANLPQ